MKRSSQYSKDVQIVSFKRNRKIVIGSNVIDLTSSGNTLSMLTVDPIDRFAEDHVVKMEQNPGKS